MFCSGWNYCPWIKIISGLNWIILLFTPSLLKYSAYLCNTSFSRKAVPNLQRATIQPYKGVIFSWKTNCVYGYAFPILWCAHTLSVLLVLLQKSRYIGMVKNRGTSKLYLYFLGLKIQWIIILAAILDAVIDSLVMVSSVPANTLTPKHRFWYIIFNDYIVITIDITEIRFGL